MALVFRIITANSHSFPDAGDLFNASFFLEPEVSPLYFLALDLVVGMYAQDTVIHVGDADATVAMVDTDDRTADATMMVDSSLVVLRT